MSDWHGMLLAHVWLLHNRRHDVSPMTKNCPAAWFQLQFSDFRTSAWWQRLFSMHWPASRAVPLGNYNTAVHRFRCWLPHCWSLSLSFSYKVYCSSSTAAFPSIPPTRFFSSNCAVKMHAFYALVQWNLACNYAACEVAPLLPCHTINDPAKVLTMLKQVFFDTPCSAHAVKHQQSCEKSS